MSEPSATLSRSFPADPSAPATARRTIRAFLSSRGADPRALPDILLALSEVVTNAVVHGYRGTGGRVAVEAHHDGDWLKLSVADRGRGMAPRHDSPGLGLGLPLVGRLAHQVDIVAPPDGGTRITMCFSLRSGTAGDQPGTQARLG